jgi:tRNA1(Val) A37 N6-methylase TrmN6
MDDDDIGEDLLLGGRVHVLQPKRGYRAAIDPVLLAAAVDCGSGDKVLDAGAGSGAAALCVAARLPQISVVGVEADSNGVWLARAGAERSGLAGRVAFVHGDLTRIQGVLAAESFDHVMTNPPYLAAETAQMPADADKAKATIECSMDLAMWFRCCLRMVRPQGRMTMIHRADRLGEVLEAAAGLGGIRVFPLWPGSGKPAKRIIVAGRKGSRGPLRLLAGLILHESDGRFTSQANAVLREGRAISLWD